VYVDRGFGLVFSIGLSTSDPANQSKYFRVPIDSRALLSSGRIGESPPNGSASLVNGEGLPPIKIVGRAGRHSLDLGSSAFLCSLSSLSSCPPEGTRTSIAQR
jgi:hypothetical protein